MGQKTFWVRKLFGSENFLGQIFFWVKKNFWFKKFWGQKNILGQKNIESNFLGGYKTFWVKNFLVKKNLGQNLFGSIDMGPIFLSKKTGRVKPLRK